MLRPVALRAPRFAPIMAQQKLQIINMPSRCYYKNDVLMPREYGDGYMADPIDVAERLIRLISLHDNLKVNPSEIVPGNTFEEIGLNDLDMVEVLLGAEREFDLELSDDACESFTTINDIVEHLARNFYTK